MESLVDEAKLKGLVKKALIEVIQERKDVLYEVLAEVIEDIALARAIREGEETEPISRQEIVKLLEDQA